MDYSRTSLFVFIIIGFLAGIYYCFTTKSSTIFEGLTTNSGINSRCPDILVQKGMNYFLYNSKIAQVPGVNPIEFENLEDYVEFIDWQRSQGINCPVLYLQHSYDAQGEAAYKIRPSPSDLQGGLPPSIATAATNNNPYSTAPTNAPTDDSQPQTTITNPNGSQENLLFSPNAMDDNWGGEKYTQNLVDRGYYAEDEVSIMIA